MAYDERALRGVGGWLAFFILTLTVFGPLRAIAQTWGNLYGDASVAAAYADRWVLLQAVEWLLVAFAVGTSMFIGWRLYAVHVWRSVQLAIAGLWLIAPIVLLVDSIAVSLIAGMSLSALLGLTAGELARTAAYGAIWTAYLLRSRRVANTYDRHPDADELAGVFD